MLNAIRSTLCALAFFGLAACGGTGGIGALDASGDKPAAPQPTPSTNAPASHPLTGSWGDSTAQSVLLIAPDGAVYGLLSSGARMEIVRGTLAAANGLVASSPFDAVDLATADSFRPLALSGSYQPKSQLLLSSDAQGPLLNAVYDPLSEQTIQAEERAGLYRTEVFSSNAFYGEYLATVDDNGNLQLRLRSDDPTRADCTISGQISPQAGVSTPLDVVLVFSGVGCQLPDLTTIKGLAQYDPNHGQLSLFGMSEDGRTALMISAYRARA